MTKREVIFFSLGALKGTLDDINIALSDVDTEYERAVLLNGLLTAKSNLNNLVEKLEGMK